MRANEPNPRSSLMKANINLESFDVAVVPSSLDKVTRWIDTFFRFSSIIEEPTHPHVEFTFFTLRAHIFILHTQGSIDYRYHLIILASVCLSLTRIFCHMNKCLMWLEYLKRVSNYIEVLSEEVLVGIFSSFGPLP